MDSDLINWMKKQYRNSGKAHQDRKQGDYIKNGIGLSDTAVIP